MGSFIVCGFLFINLDVQWNLETKEQIYKTNINIPVLKLRRNILLPINLIHFSIFFFHFGASRFSSFRTHIYTQSSEQNKKKLIINNITIITTKEAQINSINRNALHEYNFSGMSTRKHTRNQKFKFAYEKSVFFVSSTDSSINHSRLHVELRWYLRSCMFTRLKWICTNWTKLNKKLLIYCCVLLFSLRFYA